MPMRAPRACGCGCIIAAGLCACELERQRERKAHADRNRPNARQRGYDHRWAAYRAAYLRRNPMCRRCSAPAVIVDHIEPHRGNVRLFWNPANHQPLCKGCHDGWKQSLEKQNKR